MVRYALLLCYELMKYSAASGVELEDFSLRWMGMQKGRTYDMD